MSSSDFTLPPPPVPSTSRTSGSAQVVREPLGPHHLLPDRGVGGAAADGEVVALHDRAPALDPALPDHHVRGQEARSARRRA